MAEGPQPNRKKVHCLMIYVYHKIAVILLVNVSSLDLNRYELTRYSVSDVVGVPVGI